MIGIKILVPMLFAVILIVGSGTFNQAEALLASHDCSYCHDFHGNPGYSTLLIAENSELVCLSCHTVDINSTKSAAVHNPRGLASNQEGYITCRECHDAHSNQGGNEKMVGYRRDAQNWSASFTAPGIRKELPSTTGLTYNTVTFTGPTDFHIAGPTVGACETCHSAYHNEGNDCTQCHGHTDGFPKPDCTAAGCHDGAVGAGIPVARGVSVSSSHSTDTIFASKGVTFTCGDCHTSHGTAGNVLIPNNPAVGINYNSVGHGGISLGSSVVTGATEAEICWNCHVTYNVSEWGVNTDTNGGATNYNFGDIYTSSTTTTKTANWIGAWWKSATAKFGYKTGRIQSTHAVGNTATSAGVDPVEEIRCSYCHDVHDTAGIAGDVDGKPYLRGSWMGSPYREDGAPQAGDTWSTNGNYGAVPRGGTQATQQGGYQIDQNNSNPTTGGTPAHTVAVSSAWSLSNSAGLCQLCHGSDIDNLNKFGDPSAAWVGTNGHANAAIGGSGSSSTNASDIFSMAIRNPNGAPLYSGSGSARGYPRQSYGNAGNFNDPVPSGDHSTNNYYAWAWGFRGNHKNSFQLSPRVVNTQAYAYRWYNWGASVDNTLDDRYHKFSCSKCHNPHASRLPRLLITNCLDTKHNDWDDQASVSTLGSTTSYAPENRGVTFSMATSAQNCHRLADNNFTNATGMGWNQVTPWTTEGTQDNTGID